MLVNYLKIAVKVLLRRKFYTAVSLFGIAFTLLVLVLGSALMDEFLSTAYPEARANRTLGVFRALMKGPKRSIQSDAGYALLDRYARDLPGVERSSIVSSPITVASFVEGNKLEFRMRRTDGAFWEIMEFDFVEGSPFTATDEAQGNFVAVINEGTREKVFRGEPAVGRTLRVDGQAFTVVGTVRDVAPTRLLSFGEIWVPIRTSKSTTYRDELVGGFVGILLAEDRSRFAEIKTEFARRLATAQLPDPEQYDTIRASANTVFDEFARMIVGGGEIEVTPTVQAGLVIVACVLLFMALPALNLVNLNLSRILERASEIGVRKAFGASSWTLVGQFLVESVLLTLVGGLLGLVAAEIVMMSINESGLIPYASVHVNYRVFGYGLVLSVIFGLLSGA
jgi:putative ABC transport system permease protein